MKRRTLVLALSASLGLALAGPAAAEDLVQIYREAQQNDPAIAAARANWNATQERLPQARAGLLPNVGLSASANVNDGRVSVNTDPRSVTANTFNNYGYTVSATQPIFRYQNLVAYDQAKRQESFAALPGVRDESAPSALLSGLTCGSVWRTPCGSARDNSPRATSNRSKEFVRSSKR